jgi:hypothetical protein
MMFFKLKKSDHLKKEFSNVHGHTAFLDDDMERVSEYCHNKKGKKDSHSTTFLSYLSYLSPSLSISSVLNQ